MPAPRRYTRAPVIASGGQYGTSLAIPIIRKGIAGGQIRFEEFTLQEAQRLDTIAGRNYGDGRAWWIIAAASDIGFAVQAPPGTRIRIPDLADIARLLG